MENQNNIHANDLIALDSVDVGTVLVAKKLMLMTGSKQIGLLAGVGYPVKDFYSDETLIISSECDDDHMFKLNSLHEFFYVTEPNDSLPSTLPQEQSSSILPEDLKKELQEAKALLHQANTLICFTSQFVIEAGYRETAKEMEIFSEDYYAFLNK